LNGELSESGLRDAILVSTRRYAKRQDTWFRNQLREAQVWTIDATKGPEILAGTILERWASMTTHDAPRTTHAS